MKFCLQILILLVIGSSCSNRTRENQEIGTPDLTEIIYSEIEYLDKEHKILFFQADKQKDNLKELKADLRQLMKFDIDSTNLNQFRQTIQDCDGVRQRIWRNENFTLTISDFETTEQENQIELTRIDIDSQNDHLELLTVLGEPLEYLKINEKNHNPTYESRIVGLDEAIKKLKEKNGR
jgi:hypothetical protein